MSFPDSCANSSSSEFQMGRPAEEGGVISECITFHQVCAIFIDFPLHKRQARERSRSGIWGQRAASVMRSSLQDTAVPRGSTVHPLHPLHPAWHGIKPAASAAIAWQLGFGHNAHMLLIFPITSLACAHHCTVNWFHWQVLVQESGSRRL